SVMSQVTARARSSPTTASRIEDSVRPVATTWAPAAAIVATVRDPSDPPAPVTTTTRSWRWVSCRGAAMAFLPRSHVLARASPGRRTLTKTNASYTVHDT